MKQIHLFLLLSISYDMSLDTLDLPFTWFIVKISLSKLLDLGYITVHNEITEEGKDYLKRINQQL